MLREYYFNVNRRPVMDDSRTKKEHYVIAGIKKVFKNLVENCQY